MILVEMSQNPRVESLRFELQPDTELKPDMYAVPLSPLETRVIGKLATLELPAVLPDKPIGQLEVPAVWGQNETTAGLIVALSVLTKARITQIDDIRARALTRDAKGYLQGIFDSSDTQLYIERERLEARLKILEKGLEKAAG